MAAHRAHPGFWEGFHQLFRTGSGGGAHRAVGPTREPYHPASTRTRAGMVGGIGQPRGGARANVEARSGSGAWFTAPRYHETPRPQSRPIYPQYVGLFGVAA